MQYSLTLLLEFLPLCSLLVHICFEPVPVSASSKGRGFADNIHQLSVDRKHRGKQLELHDKYSDFGEKDREGKR